MKGECWHSQSMVVDQPLGFGHYCQFSEQLPTLIPVHFLTTKVQLRTRLQGLWQRQSCIKHKAALSVMIFAAGIVPSCLQVKHGGYKQKENLLLMAFSMMCDSSIYSSYIFGWGFLCKQTTKWTESYKHCFACVCHNLIKLIDQTDVLLTACWQLLQMDISVQKVQTTSGEWNLL